MNKILLSTGSLYSYGLNRIFQLASMAGFAGLELVVQDCWDYRQPEYVKKLEKLYGPRVLAVHAAMEFVTCFGENDQDRLWGSIDIAKSLRSEVLVVHPTVACKPEYHKWFGENLSVIEKKARPVLIMVENMPKAVSRKTGDLVFQNYSLDEMRQFDNIAFDTSHFASLKRDPFESISVLGNKVKHIHLSDCNFVEDPEQPGDILDEHLIPGRGKLKLKKYLSELIKSGFEGNVSVELLPESVQAGESDEVVLANLAEAYNFVKKYLGA